MKDIINEEGISPVTGVVLNTSVAVMLPMIFVAFVVSMEPLHAAPQAVLVVSEVLKSDDNITISHTGGDVLDLNKVKAIVAQGGNRFTIDLLDASNNRHLKVGDYLVLNTLNARIWLNDNALTPGATSGNFHLAQGKVTVTLIDTESNNEIARASARV